MNFSSELLLAIRPTCSYWMISTFRTTVMVGISTFWVGIVANRRCGFLLLLIALRL